MNRLNKALSIVLIVALTTSLVPSPLWGQLGQHIMGVRMAQAASTLTPTAEQSPLLATLFSELTHQLVEQNMLTVEGQPNGILMDVGAIQQLTPSQQTTQQPQRLTAPLSISQAQSTYVAETAISNTLIVTFTVTNN